MHAHHVLHHVAVAIGIAVLAGVVAGAAAGGRGGRGGRLPGHPGAGAQSIAVPAGATVARPIVGVAR